jgi:hypothetical protein
MRASPSQPSSAARKSAAAELALVIGRQPPRNWGEVRACIAGPRTRPRLGRTRGIAAFLGSLDQSPPSADGVPRPYLPIAAAVTVGLVVVVERARSEHRSGSPYAMPLPNPRDRLVDDRPRLVVTPVRSSLARREMAPPRAVVAARLSADAVAHGKVLGGGLPVAAREGLYSLGVSSQRGAPELPVPHLPADRATHPCSLPQAPATRASRPANPRHASGARSARPRPRPSRVPLARPRARGRCVHRRRAAPYMRSTPARHLTTERHPC